MIPWLLPLLWLRVASAQQRIVEGPRDTFSTIGETVVLTCKVENQQGPVQWMKNEFGLGTVRDKPLPGYKRYRMIGSTAAGEYNLQIENATLKDDDVYACQISATDNDPAVVSRSAKLTVIRFSIDMTGKRHEKPVFRQGKPPPRLGWALADDSNGVNIVTWLGETRSKFGRIYSNNGIAQESVMADITESIQVESEGSHGRNDSNVYSIISNISFVLRPEDDQKYLVCMSQHETFSDTAQTDSLKLSLRYAPRVNLTIASKLPLRENGSALLACNVDAKPLDNIKIAWFKGDDKLRDSTDTLAVETLQMSDHGKEFHCEAANAIGKTRGSLKMSVAFGARIMSTQQDKEVNEGDTASFHCATVGNPPPTVFWTKGGSDQIIGRGENLTIENVRTWQQGEYICTAAVEGFKREALSHYLHIRGPPTVTMGDELSAALDDSIEISCRISGRPITSNIRWSKNGKEINFANGRTQVHQVPQPYGVESTMKIKNVKEEDFGIYNCTANNGLGSDGRGIRVKQRSFVDLLADVDQTVALGILTAALLLLICCCCFFICRNACSSKKSKFIGLDDQSDVTVKCEALDGQFFPEMYSSSPVDNGNLVGSKDYISIPQNNPDLDYLGPPSSFGAPPNLYPKYINGSTNEYNVMCGRYDHSYGSFGSGLSTGGLSDMYGIGASDKMPVMETLQEVDTPKASNYNFLASPGTGRPMSRTSTHV
ncbi:unnamed protein product [Caenorhabditis auriculariae]|uniref:Ig-like domain-containing protein n=1 Tax=Caenorhabditis auriculariae TaxID=2777116 RepID=A0A8S1GNG8_9PELO|nr:unnamed protein product [Caenorhabditis auriculariae]